MLWASLAVGVLLGLFAGIASDSWAPAVQFTAGSLGFGAVMLFLHRVVFPRVRVGSRAGTLLLQALVAVVAVTLTSFVVMNAILLIHYGVWMFQRDESGAFVARGSWTPFGLPILPVAALAVTIFNQAWQPMRALEERARRADELAASAQLQALRAQINPHFLFNSLNSIAQLITTDPLRAEACVERLSEIFRYLLSSKDRTFVTLEDELEITDGYLDIERARFGEQLQVEFEIDDRARRWIVPTLILQPLVENAVRHGISKKVGGGRVAVRARLDGNELVLDIEDTGVGMFNGRAPADSTGVGLRNVSDRLTHLYGGTYTPRIVSRPDEGTHITLRVPERALDTADTSDVESRGSGRRIGPPS